MAPQEMMMTDDVLTFVENGVGRIRLNRPRAIHALTADMCGAINDALLAWARDDSVVAVMIDHLPAPDGDPKLSRGFCAGGDIALIARSAAADGVEAERFFSVEYRMNHLLFVYEKPIVAFMDGIVMGGGVGLSLPARYRVATERTSFAMPETGIGLFPDVGGGWYLPRLPGRTGAWLATTGARIDGADCVAVGIATHYMPSEALDAVKARILTDPYDLTLVLDAASTQPPPSTLQAARADIDRLFASDKAEEIVAALEADGGEPGDENAHDSGSDENHQHLHGLTRQPDGHGGADQNRDGSLDGMGLRPVHCLGKKRRKEGRALHGGKA